MKILTRTIRALHGWCFWRGIDNSEFASKTPAVSAMMFMDGLQ